MEEKPKKTGLIISIITVFALLAVGTFGYFIMGISTDGGVTTDTQVAQKPYKFKSVSNKNSIDFSADEVALQENESYYGLASSDDADITVSLSLSSNNESITCSFNLVWTYESDSDIYSDVGNYVPYNSDYPYEMSIKVSKNNTVLSETSMESLGTPVNNKVTIGSYTINSLDEDVYNIRAAIYNLPINQINIIGKHYSSKINVENVNCT